MTAHSFASTAYRQHSPVTQSGRHTEYAAFAAATRKLHAASLKGPAGFPQLVAALHENQRLWTIIAADVAEPTNGLPQALRARLFYLAEFTRHQSAKILSGDGSAQILIDVNTAVMRGLRGPEAQP